MKTKVTIIGAGRIAYSITSALIKNDYGIVSVISRNVNSAKMLAQKFSIKNYSNDFLDIPKTTKLFFLSVPDSEIKKAAKTLSHQRLNFKNKYFIHLSGSENIKALNFLKQKGGITASIHPMQTFPSRKIVSLKNVYAAVETIKEKHIQYLSKLCKNLEMIPFRIKSDQKTFYHLAGVYASNFLAGNLFVARKMLMQNDIPEKIYFNILSSTIDSTLDNVNKVGPAKALSGPVERGDIQTIKKHISSLKKMIKKPDGNYFLLQLKNYIVQSINLLSLAEEKQGKLSNTHLQIKKILVRELKNLKDSN
jgi:predicted short-subunit dehydrogenase-like oxidoreductase (DUF2520 family)